MNESCQDVSSEHAIDIHIQNDARLHNMEMNNNRHPINSTQISFAPSRQPRATVQILRCRRFTYYTYLCDILQMCSRKNYFKASNKTYLLVECIYLQNMPK